MRGVADLRLRQETEFFRKNNNKIVKKNRKIRTIKLKGVHIFFCIIVLSVIALLSYKVTNFLLNWEKLKIKSYLLINPPKIVALELKQILQNYQGNIFTVDLNSLKKELMALKEIKNVDFERRLPSSIKLKFLLRKPVYQIEKNRKVLLLDDEGTKIGEKNLREKHLIFLKNISSENLKKILPLGKELIKIKDSIDYVSYKEPYGLMLKLKNRSEKFYPGESDFPAKINYYLTIKKKLNLNKFRVKYVDLRFHKRIYFEYQEEG